MEINMRDRETDSKKYASYVVNLEGNLLAQKGCLVDLNTGVVEVGSTTSYGKVPKNAKEDSAHIEFRGQEFEVNKEKVGDVEVVKIKHLSAFKEAVLRIKEDNSFDKSIKKMETLRNK